MASQYPALMIRPPESPLQQIGQAQQVASGQQQLQMQQLQMQMEQQKITDQRALTTAMTQWDGQDPRTLTMKALQNGASGQAVMGLNSQILDMRQKASEVAKNDALTGQANADTYAKQADERRGRLLNVVQQPDAASKQAAWDQEVTAEEASGKVQPGSISHTYPGDQQATALANSFALGSKLVEEAQARQKNSLEAWKTVGGVLINTITGERIGGIQDVDKTNNALQTRWQVLNPGEPLPDQFKLQPGAGSEDFARVDKIMEGTERAEQAKLGLENTKTQQKTIDAIRQQSFDMLSSKEGLTWVTGTATQGPSAGKVVAVPQSDIQKYGIQDAGKMESADITKTQSGRQWLTLANKQGPTNDPSQQGIMQLIDNLDKDGKLGPLAGRWNDFMAGKFGSGDPEYSALKTKLDLSNTLLATVHSGRLGPYLMENMQSLANAGKMDGPTLKSAFQSERNYVEDRAMDPNPPANNPPPAKNAAAQGKGQLSLAEAQGYLQKAGGDKEKARALAKADGRTF